MLNSDVAILISRDGGVFISPRLAGDPPFLRIPDYAALEVINRKMFSASYNVADAPSFPIRSFRRDTYEPGECPIYMEVL